MMFAVVRKNVDITLLTFKCIMYRDRSEEHMFSMRTEEHSWDHNKLLDLKVRTEPHHCPCGPSGLDESGSAVLSVFFQLIYPCPCTHGPDSTMTEPTFSKPFSVTSLHSAEYSTFCPWKFSSSKTMS